jgi:hypothetical protein
MKSDTYTRHRCEGRHTFIRTGDVKVGCDVLECVYCSAKVVDVVHDKPAPVSASEYRRALIGAAIWGSVLGGWIVLIACHIAGR